MDYALRTACGAFALAVALASASSCGAPAVPPRSAEPPAATATPAGAHAPSPKPDAATAPSAALPAPARVEAGEPPDTGAGPESDVAPSEPAARAEPPASDTESDAALPDDVVGLTREELVARFGPPTREKGQTLTYRLPKGCAFEKWVYTLKLEGGRVASVSKRKEFVGRSCP